MDKLSLLIAVAAREEDERQWEWRGRGNYLLALYYTNTGHYILYNTVLNNMDDGQVAFDLNRFRSLRNKKNDYFL